MAGAVGVQPIQTGDSGSALFRLTFADAPALQQMLRQSGVDPDEAHQAVRLLSAAAPSGAMASGVAEIALAPRAGGQPGYRLEFLSLRPALDSRLVLHRERDGLRLHEERLKVANGTFRIRGRVGDSLYFSARAAGAPPQAVASLIRALASQIDVGEIRPEDQFDMVLVGRHAEDGRSEQARLLYAGLVRAEGRPLQLMEWPVDGRVEWVEASGAGKAGGMLQRPVPGSVSSDFGLRQHPILGYTRMHKGIDFRAGYGTPILAVADGRVAAAGWAGGYGEQVRLLHGSGLVTSYSHMSRITAEPGSLVRQGEVIGYVGSTGLSTGPHLHFETYVNGMVVDPASVRLAAQPKLAGAALAAFRAQMRQLLALRPEGLPRA